MNIRYTLIYLLLCIAISISNAQEQLSVQFPADYSVEYRDGNIQFEAAGLNGLASLDVNGETTEVFFSNGIAPLEFPTDHKGSLVLLKPEAGNHSLYHISIRKNGDPRVRSIPLWLSIIPPLVAIGLALLFKEVIISLFLGVWSGAFIAGGMRFESFGYYFTSFWDVVEKYIVGALADADHLAVILFSLLIGGMVAIISRNGGMAGIVERLAKYARSPRSTQFVTWLLGVAIFFDDYANTLIVGNTMRSVTDRFKISREKLAYIVDSTAAPVSAVAFITTWIGAELGYIGDGIEGLVGFEGGTPYAIFLSSLKYSFYPIMTLAFILILIYTKRDFGPMLKAERRARTTGQVSERKGDKTDNSELENLDPVEGAPHKGRNALIPVVLVILMTIFGLLVTGFENTYYGMVDGGTNVASMRWGAIWQAMGSDGFFMKLGTLIGNSNSYTALIWASTTGVVAAIFLTISGRIMKLPDTMNTLITGFKTMLPALIILTLAWALAITTKELQTATYLSSALENSLNPYVVPMIIFILAALIAFSTGSSWSTMAILFFLSDCGKFHPKTKVQT